MSNNGQITDVYEELRAIMRRKKGTDKQFKSYWSNVFREQAKFDNLSEDFHIWFEGRWYYVGEWFAQIERVLEERRGE